MYIVNTTKVLHLQIVIEVLLVPEVCDAYMYHVDLSDHTSHFLEVLGYL